MTDLIKELRAWKSKYFNDSYISNPVVDTDFDEILRHYENDKAEEYPDTHLYTLDEAQEIMKKENDKAGDISHNEAGGGYSGECGQGTPAPVERRDGLREELEEFIYKAGKAMNIPDEDGFPDVVRINVDEFQNILSRHPSTSVSTEELIAELEKRRPDCKDCKCHTTKSYLCLDCGSCLWEGNIGENNFTPIDGKEAK